MTIDAILDVLLTIQKIHKNGTSVLSKFSWQGWA